MKKMHQPDGGDVTNIIGHMTNLIRRLREWLTWLYNEIGKQYPE
jgi:hypothetical protein